MKDDTKLIHMGRDSFAHSGAVNTPVYRASTILFPTMEQYLTRSNDPTVKVRYGLRGTPTTFALEDALTALEGGAGTVLNPSGLQAISMALMSFVEAGDHVLVTDSTYSPCRSFCDKVLSNLGVTTEYYDPLIGAGIKDLLRENTKIVWTESPGSQTFEVQDIPAIATAAHEVGAIVMIDNTWSAGYYFKPLEHGVDVSVHASTKYMGGHSDVMMGAIICNEKTFARVKSISGSFGNFAAPDDVFLTLRGLRTMGVRLQRQYKNGLKVAKWIADQPGVTRVMHPALETDPGHEIWKRDFTGASSLFGFVVSETDRKKVGAFLDGMAYFGMGSSWGGFESLLIPTFPASNRTATKWDEDGQSLRIHIGLEDPEDLIA
ncbi:MAG: cystathionine beta-lyase, partial [Proteobacteria bacterium]|nr:cystathionine beta-lyase [Pseudomonadota bacterium]